MLIVARGLLDGGIRSLMSVGSGTWQVVQCQDSAKLISITVLLLLYAFFASLSAFLKARFLISTCIFLLKLNTMPFIVPANVAMAQCMIPCDQYGVLVAAMPCAPPLLPIFPKAALTNCLGFGIIAEDLLIFDIADVTR